MSVYWSPGSLETPGDKVAAQTKINSVIVGDQTRLNYTPVTGGEAVDVVTASLTFPSDDSALADCDKGCVGVFIRLGVLLFIFGHGWTWN